MKYTFTKVDGNEKTVNIPDEWLSRTKNALHISSKEAINMWLCDHDLITNEEQEALNARAASAGRVLDNAQTKERKKPARKPDQTKRDLIKYIYDFLCDNDIAENIQIVNIERIISFNIGEDTYDLTLSKKRKPKN